MIRWIEFNGACWPDRSLICYQSSLATCLRTPVNKRDLASNVQGRKVARRSAMEAGAEGVAGDMAGPNQVQLSSLPLELFKSSIWPRLGPTTCANLRMTCKAMRAFVDSVGGLPEGAGVLAPFLVRRRDI